MNVQVNIPEESRSAAGEQSLRDKVVLVTGGARGLGEAVCANLAEAGARVVCADVRFELAEQVAEPLDGARALRLDVSDWSSVQAGLDDILGNEGRIDVLVNNAGIDITLPVDELSVEDWQRVIATNLTGPFMLCKAVLPRMREQGGGQIVNIVSTAAKRTWPNACAYHSSKWGLLGLSHALHVEARPQRVKVTALVAGGMRTPFLLDRFPDIDVSTLQDPRSVARSVRFVLTQPEETVIPELMVLPMTETSWP